MLARYILYPVVICSLLSTMTQVSGGEFAEKTRFTDIVFDDGAGAPLRGPSSLFYDREARELFVVDTGNRRIVIYDRRLTAKYSFEHYVVDRSSGRLVPGEPKRVVCNSNADIFIIDNLANYVEMLDFRGSPLLRIYPDSLLGDTTLSLKPDLLDIDEQDNLYFSVTGDLQTILTLDRELKLKRTIGKKGENPEEFSALVGMEVHRGYLYLVDLYAIPAVKIFDTSGTYLYGFGAHDVERIDLSMGSGIVVAEDSSGTRTIWISDALRQVVKVFTQQGDFVDNIGGFGFGVGEFRYPADIVSGDSNSFYVVERVGCRIQRFQVK